MQPKQHHEAPRGLRHGIRGTVCSRMMCLCLILESVLSAPGHTQFLLPRGSASSGETAKDTKERRLQRTQRTTARPLQLLASTCYLSAEHSHACRGPSQPCPPATGCRSSVFLRAEMTCLTCGKLPSAFATQAYVYIKCRKSS